MTYRRLFRHILIASTVVLVLLWGGSLFYSATAARTPFRFTIAHGTLESEFTRMSPESENNDIVLTETLNGSFDTLPDRGMDHPLGRWKAVREEKVIFSTPGPSTPPDIIVHVLHVPLWAPWLLVVACALVFCRVMEKRSATGKEKNLAEASRRGRL